MRVSVGAKEAEEEEEEGCERTLFFMTSIVHNYPLWNNGRVVIKYGAYVGLRVVINHFILCLSVLQTEGVIISSRDPHLGLAYVVYCPLY